jgi:hypothetical protein
MSKNKAKEVVSNESSLTQFKSFNVLKHPLNRFCGIFLIFVGDRITPYKLFIWCNN